MIAAALLALAQGLEVRSDFPGGSVRIEGVDPAARAIRVSPAFHPDRGWTCWWYFKVKGLTPGETLTLDVGGGVWATPDRAVWSADGKTWAHTAPGERKKDRIVYRQAIPGTEAWFAWGPPFVLSHAAEAVAEAAKAGSFALPFELCRSREGRSVPAVRVTEAGDGRYRIWVQARQHAWEAGSSWVCRGFLDWLVSDDERARALRRKAEVVVIPVMDADNVERGAGGKNQKPQDHNRDWSDTPHWPEVKAAQQAITEAGVDFFIDLHNPAAGDRNPFFFVPPQSLLSPRGAANLGRFVEAAREEIAGPLKLAEKTRESGPGYDKNWELISKNWVARHAKDHAVALTLETSWNTPASTVENYRRVGRELGLAIERYLRASPRAPH